MFPAKGMNEIPSAHEVDRPPHSNELQGASSGPPSVVRRPPGLAHLYDIQAGGSGAPHVDCDGLHQGALGKVLYLLRHGGTEEQGLPLALRKGGAGAERMWGLGQWLGSCALARQGQAP